MIDVYIRYTKRTINDPLRYAFLEATRARWVMDPDAVVHSLVDLGIREARELAEREAKSDPYIFSDDDVVVVGKDWVARGVAAMTACQGYAVCSSLSLIEGENAARPPAGAKDGDIYPMHMVGAPMWIRKGFFTEFTEMDLNSECRVLHEYTLAKGKQQGLIVGLRHLHLGHGFSSTPGLDFGY